MADASLEAGAGVMAEAAAGMRSDGMEREREILDRRLGNGADGAE